MFLVKVLFLSSIGVALTASGTALSGQHFVEPASRLQASPAAGKPTPAPAQATVTGPVTAGVLADEAGLLLSGFFARRR